jgi:CBS domain-containing protein
MICPQCGQDNVPGSENCSRCGQDLTQLDQPSAHDRVERSLIEERVSSLRPKRPVSLLPTATVGEAIRLMLEHNIGAVLVVNATGKLEGILSERDILLKVAGLREGYASLPVWQFMTPDPDTVAATDTLAFALDKMDSHDFRHLAVLDDEQPIGVISVRDMLRHIVRLF